jgi:hypothetical protein
MRKLLAAVLLVFGFAPFTVFAQVTDISQTITTKLNGYGPVPKTITTTVPHQVTVCSLKLNSLPFLTCETQTQNTTKPQTINALLTASAISVVKSEPPTYGTPTSTELPAQMIVGNFLAENCTANPATPSFSVSTSFQTSSSRLLKNDV